MTDIEHAEQSTAQSARKKRLIMVTGLSLITGAAVGGYYLFSNQAFQSTDNAYVNGHVVDISPQIAGAIAEIYVDNTDRVKAGTPLIDIDPSDVDIALAEAQAELARTRRTIEVLFSQQKQAEALVHAEKVRLGTAVADLQARQGLAAQDLISKEELRHAADAVKVAQANVDTAVAAQHQVLAQTQGVNVDTHPDVLKAKETLEKALLNLKRSSIIAPVSGMVAQRTVQLGEQVRVGEKLLSIIPLDQMWIDANFKETQLNGICPGQAAEISVDSYGRKVKYTGQVQDIMVGSGSAFSVLPAQNATGNWIKVVQRVPVRIKLDAKELAQHPLRIGLSAEVKIDTSRCGQAATTDKTTDKTTQAEKNQHTAVLQKQAGNDAKAVIQLFFHKEMAAVNAIQRDGNTIHRG